MTYQYYKRTLTTGELRALVRLQGNRVEHYDGKDIWNGNWVEAGQAYMDIIGMSGGWYVYAPGQAWKRQRRSAWLVMDLGDREVVQFGGPTMRLVRKAELGRDSRLALLGPDLLDPGFTPETGAIAIETAGTVELGEALLDQKLVCGIGNIFKSESCWAAKFDPWRKVETFTRGELEELMAIAQKQLVHGAGTGRRPQRIYKMAGRPCPRCRHRVKSRGQGLDNRTTYWCPNCQK